MCVQKAAASDATPTPSAMSDARYSVFTCCTVAGKQLGEHSFFIFSLSLMPQYVSAAPAPRAATPRPVNRYGSTEPLFLFPLRASSVFDSSSSAALVSVAPTATTLVGLVAVAGALSSS